MSLFLSRDSISSLPGWGAGIRSLERRLLDRRKYIPIEKSKHRLGFSGMRWSRFPTSTNYRYSGLQLVEPQLDGHTPGLAQVAFSEKACIDRASWPTPTQTAVI
jgi:hypothetical protein